MVLGNGRTTRLLLCLEATALCFTRRFDHLAAAENHHRAHQIAVAKANQRKRSSTLATTMARAASHCVNT